MKNYFKISFLCFVLFLTSCVKDIDFNQVNDIELTPTIAVALAKFEFNQGSLVDNITNAELRDITDRVTFSAFDNVSSNSKNKLHRLTILFDIKNEFDRAFELDFSFFDANGNMTYQLQTIQVGEKSTYDMPTDVIIANNPDFLNSREAEITMRLLPSSDGSIIDINDPKKFTFNTSGNFYFRID